MFCLIWMKNVLKSIVIQFLNDSFQDLNRLLVSLVKTWNSNVWMCSVSSICCMNANIENISGQNWTLSSVCLSPLKSVFVNIHVGLWLLNLNACSFAVAFMTFDVCVWTHLTRNCVVWGFSQLLIQASLALSTMAESNYQAVVEESGAE